MNLPSTLGNNWKWRLLPGELTEELAEEMAGLAKLYDRK
jgi:4-alpha-glucanotransferase